MLEERMGGRETRPPLQAFSRVLAGVASQAYTLPVHLVLGAGARGEQDMTLGGSHENQEVESSPYGCNCGNVSSIHMGHKSEREFLGPVGHSS